MQGQWRDSARRARLLVLDAEAVIPILLFLVHITWWTFSVAMAFSVTFAILNRFGFTVTVFGRILRHWIVGPQKLSRPWRAIF